ncbi:MAG: ABC transporter ATP-binding protein [Chloroflexi bacterium]|nr:MAG: ABC transporter ATP-binding protein [Chloroflexota bacterium]MBL1193605.1 ABC transporter ATP-binding protein [Chloroflexota bacterium]NOH10897.1 ABC transporter ATP-binding protein [Chloroflexota bacterium]
MNTRDVWRSLGFLRNYRWTTLGAFFSLLLVNVANLFAPQLLRTLIDDGISALDMSAVWFAAGGLLVVALVRGLFNFLQGYWSEVSSQGVAFELRNAIFDKLQTLSFSYHDQAQTGKLMTRMTSDVERVRQFSGQGVVQLISGIIMLFGTATVLLFMNWRLALIVLAVIPLILIIFALMVRQVFPFSMRVQQKLAGLNSILQENLAGMRVVKAFAREEYELDRYTKQNKELLAENMNFVQLFTTFFPLIFFVVNLTMLAVVWVGGLQVINTTLTLGELVAFTNYLMLLLMPLFMVGMVGALLSQAAASAERLFEVIDAESEVQEKEGALDLLSPKGQVSFADVHFRYIGGEEDVINGISFESQPGETIAILGQTGSGKSTIINLIPRFYDVTGGKVTIDGVDVRDLKLDSLRSQIGIVLQESTLFSGTIRENIAYGRPESSLDDVVAAAKAAQAHEFIQELPDGYDTLVGERGVGLSGGQKQRVAIARALLIDPQVLILDDSTSAVDAETEYLIQQALDELMAKRTSFVIAQRISTVRDADQILLLDGGELVARGTHEELLRTSELYIEIIETQFGERSETTAVVEKELAL